MQWQFSLKPATAQSPWLGVVLSLHQQKTKGKHLKVVDSLNLKAVQMQATMTYKKSQPSIKVASLDGLEGF